MFKPNLKVPFNHEGMLRYEDSYVPHQLIPNQYVTLELTVVDADRYMQKSKLHFEDKAGLKYQMFMSDVPDLLRYVNITKGSFTAEFYFVKRCSDFGIKLRIQ